MTTPRSKRRGSGTLPARDPGTTDIPLEQDPNVVDLPVWEAVDDPDDPDAHRHHGLSHSHYQDGRTPHGHGTDGRVVFLTRPGQGEDSGDVTAVTGPAPYEPPALTGPHPAPDPDPDTPQVAGEAAGRAVAEQERYATGANGLPTDPETRERLRGDLRRSLDYLDQTEPAPPAIPTPEGVSRPGTSIAHPGALSLLNSIHGVTDDALNHEMTWHAILTPLVVEMATYHADQRPQGGSGPELAPLELLMRARDALEHIVQPRLQASEVTRDG